jgi:tetratricopeptide (TPR) repeat protein
MRRAPRGDKLVQFRENGAVGRAPDKGNAVDGVRKPDRNQMECFEEGIRLFQAHQYHQALEQFQAAERGADRAVAHVAATRSRMCEGRLEAPVVELKTVEDHYNYAVTLMNMRELGAAQKHLQIALQADPAADHVLYALGACQSLAGDFQGAYENLRRAIAIRPCYRRAARADPDFSASIESPMFRGLIFP